MNIHLARNQHVNVLFSKAHRASCDHFLIPALGRGLVGKRTSILFDSVKSDVSARFLSMQDGYLDVMPFVTLLSVETHDVACNERNILPRRPHTTSNSIAFHS